MLWISLCVARLRRDCTSQCGMRPSGFRQAIRGKRSGALNPPCEMPGRQLALLWVCLWKSCSHSPLKKAFGDRGKGIGRGRRISPDWRKSQGKGAVECATTVRRETVDSGSTHGAAEHASADRRGLSWKAGKPSIHGHHGVERGSPGDIFTGIPVPRISCGKAVGKPCRKRAAGAAPGIRPNRGSAGRDRPAVRLRTAVDILWIKLLAKCWRKCLARSRPWPAGLAVFYPSPMLRKSPGRSAREASQGPAWALRMLWITLWARW